MQGIASGVKAWLGHRLVTRVQRKGVDLSTLSLVPESLRMPLRRNGMDPVPDLGLRRDADPVTRLARLFGMNIWLVTGHAETQQVLADTKRYSTDIRPFVGRDGAATGGEIGGLGFTDPPEHTRLRKVLTPEFTMRRLEAIKPRITEIVEQQLDIMEAAGPVVDVVETFAFPIPFQVICELLGLPYEDRESFRKLGDARFDVSHGGVGSLGAVSQSREFLKEATRKQRKDPGDGLIGRIIKEHGDAIDDLALAGLADGVFTGGFETSASMLALGTVVLLREPEQFAALGHDDAAVERTVEELLRYLTVVQIAFPRFAKQDMQLFGHDVSEGDVVVCSLTGANRDARIGAGMDDFDPTRPAVSHFAFGHGFHRCIGAELARMELRAAYPALARRFPEMTLAVEPKDLAFRDLSLVYGVDAVPVRLRPTAVLMFA